MSDYLVVYFSRPGNNYVSGSIENLPVGNAEVIAKKIIAQSGADEFRIEPLHPYPEDYYACTDVAKRELGQNARPELKHDLESLDGYSTVILVYPNWWGTMPMAVYAFLEAHDFSGKTILPVCTHEGSGLAGTEGDIAKACPGATVGRGLAIKGSQASESDSAIAAWLEKSL